MKFIRLFVVVVVVAVVCVVTVIKREQWRCETVTHKEITVSVVLRLGNFVLTKKK